MSARLSAFVVVMAACAGPQQRPAVLVSWNQRLITMADEEDKLLTLKGARAAAMMHIAMHDAVNAIARRYRPYAFAGAEPRADPVAAAAQAAYEVAVHEYPARRAELEEELLRWLARAPGGD